MTTYLTGIEVAGRLRERFSVKFYVVAMLFIIFDIETIFLYPWAVTFRQLGLFGLVEMGIFLALVLVAYAYIWRKGGLEWEEPRLEREPGELHASDVPGPVTAPAARSVREAARAG